MKTLISKLWAGLSGRKTYLVAAVVAIATSVLLILHRLTPVSACPILLFAVSAFGATYRSALKRHQAELVGVLGDAVILAGAVAGRQVPAAVAAAEEVFTSGSQLVDEVRNEVSAESGAGTDQEKPQ